MARILVVDDEESIRRGVGLHLKKHGHDVREAASGEAAMRELAAREYDLVLSDLRMPGINGLELLAQARAILPELSIVMMTAYATIESAVEAMKQGADDYISKPIKLDELSLRVHSVLSRKSLVEENARLRQQLRRQFGFESLVGESETMRKLRDRLSALARDANVSVLVTGESGTGKELVAKAIHHSGPRRARMFVAVNCAALPDALLESELFGYEKGAFTGAAAPKKGLFETADGGTLLLDEISSMSPAMQAKLLRVVQERSFRRLGSTEEKAVDVRIISASNQNLPGLVSAGCFREDLYYRLAVVPVYLPPLRERERDVPRLANYFLEKLCRAKSKSLTLSDEALAALSTHSWPGNVRELENLIEMLVATREAGVIGAQDLPDKFRAVHQLALPTDVNDLKEASRRLLSSFEKQFIRTHLEANHWNVTKTAGEIGISRAALHEKIKEYGLEK